VSNTPQFRTIPAHDEVSTLERDLRFRPAVWKVGAVLSQQQLEQFNREGYLKPFRVFDEEEIIGHRAYFDDLLARVLAEGGSSYSISTAHLKYGTVYDILTHPRIVALVQAILGDNVVAWGSHYFCKLPGDAKPVHWHQDASYWPLTPAHAVTVWLAIDDADRENGCMRFLPGSHHYGHLTYRLTEESENAVLNQAVEEVEQFGDPVDVELGAGEVSLHTDLLLHGSEPNRSPRRRCGLTLRYCAAEVRASLDWNLKGVLVAGSDPTGHWANQPRPPQD